MRWLADENFNLRGLIRRRPSIDVVRVQDVGMTGVDDEVLLAWAADNDRVLLTHDVSTITAHAYHRVMQGARMPGVFETLPDLVSRLNVIWSTKRLDDIGEL